MGLLFTAVIRRPFSSRIINVGPTADFVKDTTSAECQPRLAEMPCSRTLASRRSGIFYVTFRRGLRTELRARGFLGSPCQTAQHFRSRSADFQDRPISVSTAIRDRSGSTTALTTIIRSLGDI